MGPIQIIAVLFLLFYAPWLSASNSLSDYALMVEPDSAPGTPTFSGRSLWIIENILAPGPDYEKRLDTHLTEATQTEPLLGGPPLPTRRTSRFADIEVSCTSNIEVLVDFIKRKIWPSGPTNS